MHRSHVAQDVPHLLRRQGDNDFVSNGSDVNLLVGGGIV